GRTGEVDVPLTPHERFEFLPRPDLWRVLLNLLTQALRGALSLNECLYFSPRVLAALRDLAQEISPDVVIADMVRTAPFARRLDRPWILDLDDLLSKRYEDWSRNWKSGEVLGYLKDWPPVVLRTAIRWLTVPILRFESRLMRRRELALAREATVCTLVSHQEAEALSTILGRRVWWAPMSIPMPVLSTRSPRTFNPTPVFFGGLDYAANLEAVSYFKDVLGPYLRTRSGLPSTLDVIGFCTGQHQRSLDGEHVRLLGYAPDLHERLASYSI